MYSRERRSFAPIKVGDEVDVTIEAVGAKGDGIAKVKGFVIFVAGTKQGDTVKVRITKVLRKVGFADVVGEGSGAPQTTSNSEEQESDENVEEYNEDSDDMDEEE